MAYNLKINKNGTYRQFCGWTVICPVEYDMKFIENFINKNNVLREYFSALPSSSYHVTLYNIWSNFSNLLTSQQDFLDKQHDVAIKQILEQQSKSVGWFNPGNCMENLFSKLHRNCEKRTESMCLIINKVLFSGNTLTITFKHRNDFEKVTNIRRELIEVAERDDRMSYLHMTLAYKFRNLSDEDVFKINTELNILNMLLDNQTVIISPANLHYFSDMTEFIRFKP